MPVDKVALRAKLKREGKKIPAWLQDKSKQAPAKTEAQKKAQKKEAEMKRLKAEKTALKERGGRKEPTKTRKTETKAVSGPANDKTEAMLKKLREDKPTYFKKRK